MTSKPKPKLATWCAVLVLALLLAGPHAAWGFEFNQWGVSGSLGEDMEIAQGRLRHAGLMGHVAGELWSGGDMRLDLRLELQAGWFWDYDSGYEAAFTGGVRLYLGCPCAAAFFLEAGVGPSYNSLDIDQLGMGFNFLSFGGMGVRVQISQGMAWEVGYRMRHISNAGLHHRNIGVTNHQFMTGVVFDF